MFWGKEFGDKVGHFFELHSKDEGRPVCDVDLVVSRIKKTTAKPLCPECVEKVGAPKKAS